MQGPVTRLGVMVSITALVGSTTLASPVGAQTDGPEAAEGAESETELEEGEAPSDEQRAEEDDVAPVLPGAAVPDSIEVQVIGDKADAMQKIPGSGTFLGPEEIDRADPQDAAELLRRVPGVSVRQDSAGGGRLDIGVRGLDPGRSRRVLLLEDGIPIGNNPYAEPDLYWVPPAERWAALEVVKGSGNILFGPQTVTGVINFITPYVPWRREVTLEATGGQRGFAQGLGRYGDRHGDVGYLAQIVVRRGDGFRDQGFRTVDTFAKVDFPTSDTGNAVLKIGLHDYVADADDVGLTSVMWQADPRRNSLAPNDESRTRRYHASLTHQHRFSEAVSLRTLAYGYALTRAWRRQDYTRFPVAGDRYTVIVGDPSVPEGAIYFEPTNRTLDRTYLVGGFEPKLEVRFATGVVEHTLDVGARVLGEGAHYEQRAGDNPQTYSGALELDETRTTVAGALYLQDRMAFLDEVVLLTPGLRLEYARYERQIDRQPTATGAEDVDISGDSDVLGIIPGIGITAGTPDMHGFAGAHVGFAPPRAASSIASNGNSELLEDERSIIYEAGVRLGERRFWQIEAAGFLNNFFNQIVPATVGAQTTLVNGGKTRQMGLESAATMAFGKLVEHGVLLDVTARYTIMRAEFVGGDEDGNQLPYAPNHLLNAILDVGHEVGIGAQLAYGYVGPQLTDDLNTIEEDVTGRVGRLDGYHRLDASVRYRETHTGLTARLSVKDVIDRPFVISRRPEGIFGAGYRQIMASLRWDYEAER